MSGGGIIMAQREDVEKYGYKFTEKTQSKKELQLFSGCAFDCNFYLCNCKFISSW